MTSPRDESELVLYQTEDGITRLHVRLVGGTVWITQRQLADLYQVTVSAISHGRRSGIEMSARRPAGAGPRSERVRDRGKATIHS